MKLKAMFLTIVILAAVLRLWNLDSFPVGLNADEASLGYNAYSLLHTGKDEYGVPFPLVFKSFGDYKPGLYVYMALPFVAALGLNEMAVRLPSALLGIATVLLIFFLARKIFNNSNIGLLAMFLLAINPWHLHFSRGAWETNVATFLMTLGILLFLKTLENIKYLLPSLISLLAAMYTYQSPRLVVPILMGMLVLIHGKYFFKNIKFLIKPIIIVAILSIPLLLQFTTGVGLARFSGLSFLADVGPGLRVNELRGEHSDLNSFETKFLHNKLIAYGTSFLGHYLDHFTGNFLFIDGDPLIRDKVPETGQFYLIEALFIGLGLLFMLTRKIKYSPVLFVWVLVAPIASAMTFQTPNALRSENMVVPLTLISAFGLFQGISIVKNRLRYLSIGVVAVVLIFEFSHYLESYYVHYPQRYPLSWEYGFKTMIWKLNQYEGQFDKVIITDRYDQPYILVLFYKKYDPIKYQPQAKLSIRDKFNFGTIRSFDKYEFRPINLEELSRGQRILYIGTESEIPKNANIFDKVDFLNGEPAFIFAKT